jgi:hypothetical protein
LNGRGNYFPGVRHSNRSKSTRFCLRHKVWVWQGCTTTKEFNEQPRRPNFLMMSRMNRTIKFTAFLAGLWLITATGSSGIETLSVAEDKALGARVITVDWQTEGSAFRNVSRVHWRGARSGRLARRLAKAIEDVPG